MKTKMIPRQFTVLGYEEFSSDLDMYSAEYCAAMAKWAQEKKCPLTEEEDIDQMLQCKDQVLTILRSTRHDAVMMALAEFFACSSFDKKPNLNLNSLKVLLNMIANNTGEQPVRVAAWDCFKSVLSYDDYQKLILHP
jgi:hypothetical protein